MIQENRRQPAERFAFILAFTAILVGTFFIHRAEHAYNQVYDETAHIACGMEWLSRGTYTYETLHPPLARVATAWLPYLWGAHTQGIVPMAAEGNAILNYQGQYSRNLVLARLGMLPFFWLACVVIFIYARRHFSAMHAAIAVVLFALWPVVLAASSLAITDAPFMTFFFCSVVCFSNYLEKPTLSNGALAVISFGLGTLSKFTQPPFFLVAALLLVAQHTLTKRRLLAPVCRLVLIVVCSAPLIWAVYRFSFAPLFTPATTYDRAERKLDTMTPARRALLTTTKIPAPELFRGLLLAYQGSTGIMPRRGYLMGKTYYGGRWDFFPVDLLTKTPLPNLILCALGTAACLLSMKPWRYRPAAVIFAGIVGPLIPAMTGKVNLGLRHILPIFPFLAILGSIGALYLWQLPERHRLWARSATLVLLAWSIESTVSASPEFLPYFNEIASSHADYFLVDSDLDWGQDLYKLERQLQNVPASQVSLDYFGDVYALRKESAQWHKLVPGERPHGWVAISETNFREFSDGAYGWLAPYPYTMVGKSIRLYHLD